MPLAQCAYSKSGGHVPRHRVRLLRTPEEIHQPTMAKVMITADGAALGTDMKLKSVSNCGMTDRMDLRFRALPTRALGEGLWVE